MSMAAAFDVAPSAVSLAKSLCASRISAQLAAGGLFGMGPKEPMTGVSVFDLPHGNVYVINQNGLAGWTPRSAAYMPCLCRRLLREDLDATKKLLDGNGVPYNAHKYPAIWAAPEHTCGPVVSFIQA